MPELREMNSKELENYKMKLVDRYQKFLDMGLKLDMTRGKPCPEQLDLSMAMFKDGSDMPYKTENGVDCRNYGGVDGIPEAKEFFAQFLEVEPEEIIVGGNSSLTLMHDIILRAMVLGMVDSDVAWSKLPKVKFLCPSPGYDRHFSVCEYLGIEMIPIDMKEDGPDVDAIENLVAEDESIKGMWCVPKYSNPTGATYSDKVIDRLASMKTKAKDFRIFCDNAYNVHHLTDNPDQLKNILTACKDAGHPERVFIFGSTSKITFAGAGVAMMSASVKNIQYTLKHMSFQSIGSDKLNQLRHVHFFRNVMSIEDLMKKHAHILKPKFDTVQEILEKELGDKNVASWSRPSGGYFVSIDTPDGCAKAVVKRAAEAGVKLTPAGATFPYKNDKRDRNIRIAPSFPPIEDIRLAMELLAICIQLESVDKLL